MTATPAGFTKKGYDQPQEVPFYGRQAAVGDAYAQAMPPQAAQHPLLTPNVRPQPVGPGTPLGMPQQAQVSLFQRQQAQPDADTQYKMRNANGQGQMQVGPPTIKVTFEVKGTPFQQEAFYHAIICEGANLVLVFDRRAVGFPRVFPQDTDADVAVAIEGRDAIYICQVTGQRFQYQDQDFCILLIKETFPIG